MPESLFVYGTLRNKKIQEEVFGRSTEGETDALEGYVGLQIKLGGRIYPVIVPGDGIIEGRVLEVTSQELEMIDLYETDAYKRTTVVLKSGKEAWVYQKNEE